ncbi:MAG TPA: tetratricopeptide repeat protein [Anaeromyxobacter sp.]|nr:tetratricopeptide repeat protein [Anaeromyxobacter sp.]
MPSPQRPLTAAELSSLEHAFAADPASDAYRPLTEAYLAAGRFMEAMVVCKKGVKAHPDDPSARLLLARVYADQGKDRKALEELQGIIAAYPTFAAANRMAGVLHFRLGERDQGEAALRRAHDAAPDDPEVREALAKHGVSLAPKPPPAPPVAPRVASRAAAMAAAASAAAPDPHSISSEIRITEEAPAPTPVPSKRKNTAYSEALAEKYATREFTLSTPAGKAGKRRGKGHKLLFTLGLAFVLAAALGGWFLFSRSRKATIEGIDRLLKETVPLVEKDVWAAYVEAAKKCKEILDLDDASIAGHAYLAYVDAMRAGEHGEGKPLEAEAVRNVEAARRLGQRHSHLVAAEAYLKLNAGDPAGARETLKAVLEGDDAAQSPFLLGVLGAVQLREGDLDAARDTLAKAQKASAGDVRIAFLLAEQFRRRGEGYELQAAGFYDYALRIHKDHLGSILGKALVLLGRGQVDEAGKAAALVLQPQSGASRPQQALAHAIRAGVLGAQGKADEAAKAEEEAAKLDPSSADIPALAGQRKLRAGDAAGAVEALQRAVSLDSKRVSLVADLVRALLAKEGGAKQAIETVKRTIARLGEHPRLALVLGDAYRAAGDADLARGQYEKAIQLGRPFPDARVALARLHRAKNNIPGALVELTQAIDEYGSGGAGGAASAYVEMAEAERARGARSDLLKDLFTKALERDPASCDALWGAAKVEIDQGRLSEDGKRRLEMYTRVCPRGAHVAEAARLVPR